MIWLYISGDYMNTIDVYNKVHSNKQKVHHYVVQYMPLQPLRNKETKLWLDFRWSKIKFSVCK